METNRIWCAEQITVSPDLPGVLKEYTKAVIRESPADVLAFSAEYFRKAAKVLSAADFKMVMTEMISGAPAKIGPHLSCGLR